MSKQHFVHSNLPTCLSFDMTDSVLHISDIRLSLKDFRFPLNEKITDSTTTLFRKPKTFNNDQWIALSVSCDKWQAKAQNHQRFTAPFLIDCPSDPLPRMFSKWLDGYEIQDLEFAVKNTENWTNEAAEHTLATTVVVCHEEGRRWSGQCRTKDKGPGEEGEGAQWRKEILVDSTAERKPLLGWRFRGLAVPDIFERLSFSLSEM